MATYASTNRTALSYIAEATFGTDPGTAKQEIRYTGESLNFNIDNTVSDEIRSDRNTTDLIQVSAEAAGDINFELSYGSFDDLIEAAFASTWQTDTPSAGLDTIEPGITLKSFSIDKHFQDAETESHFNFTGMRVGTFSLDFSVGSIVTGAFSFMGLDATGTEAAPSPSATAPSTTSVMNAVTNVSNVLIDAGAAGCLNTFSMVLNNGLRGQDCVGNLGHSGISLGRIDLTGNLNIYFASMSEFTKFKAGTAFELTFDLTDAAGNKYSFTFPELKYETLTIVSGGLDGDVMAEASWRGLYDATDLNMMSIVRDPA